MVRAAAERSVEVAERSGGGSERSATPSERSVGHGERSAAPLERSADAQVRPLSLSMSRRALWRTLFFFFSCRRASSSCLRWIWWSSRWSFR